MAFTLKVEFSGLCLHLVHSDKKRIGIAMPDARIADGNPGNAVHADGTPALAHVGYLRYDLANTDLVAPGETRDHPTFEVTHLFDFEELDFGLDPEPRGALTLEVPEVTKFASLLKTVPKLFATDPPKELLMRTVLHGGSIDSVPADEVWTIAPTFNGKLPEVKGKFAGFATWTRTVDADQLELRLKEWDGAEKAVIRLFPTNGMIKLKIANLCAVNPMEWPELGLRRFDGPADDDFKWFYRLLRHPKGSFKLLIGGKNVMLPAPILDRLSPTTAGGTPNCTSCQFAIDFDQH